MKKNNKQRLFEIMSRLDSSFNTRLSEEIDIDGLHLTDDNVNAIMKGYLEAAIWTEEERLKEESQSDDNDDNGFNNEESETESEIRFMQIMREKISSKPIVVFTKENIDPNSLIQAYIDIKTFLMTAGSAAITEALEDNDEFRLGMDVWLTRNRHGSGFFDHSYDDDNEKRLTSAAQNLKEVDLYIGDDNKLHFSNAR